VGFRADIDLCQPPNPSSQHILVGKLNQKPWLSDVLFGCKAGSARCCAEPLEYCSNVAILPATLGRY
jgi:hypothetical protein